jgi:hypothetical protein
MRNKKGYGMKKDKGTKIAGGPSFEIRPIEIDPPQEPDAVSKRAWNRFTQTPEGARLKERARKVGQKYKI